MMDTIKSFYIEINVDNCKKLYDYGHSTYHYPPADGKWDPTIVTCGPQIHKVDIKEKHAKVLVEKMDTIINDSKCMEKLAKEEEKCDFMHSEHDLPNRVLPVFKPGDAVSGHVFLVLSKPLEAQSLKIYLQGKARTLLTCDGSDLEGTDVYAEEETLAWQTDKGRKGDVGDKFTLLDGGNVPSSLQSKVLPAGDHKFFFEFTLPSECPGSTPDLIASCGIGSNWSDYAYIFYRVKAKIDSGKTFTRDPVTYKGLWVDQMMDIAADEDDMSPFSLDKCLDTGIAFCKGGRVSCTAKLPRRAFVRGEEIPITLEIENQASGEIAGVEAQVVLSGEARAGTGLWAVKRPINLKGKKVEETGIPKGKHGVIQLKVPLDFSESPIDSNLIPAGTLSDCPIIDVQYDVAVKVKRPGLHRNIEMDIPIKIGNLNGSAAPPSDGLYPKLY